MLIHQDTQVLMPGGPKLTPNDPEKKRVMEKWVNQGAMIMRSVTQQYQLLYQKITHCLEDAGFANVSISYVSYKTIDVT